MRGEKEAACGVTHGGERDATLPTNSVIYTIPQNTQTSKQRGSGKFADRPELGAAVLDAVMARDGRREGTEIRFLCPSHDDHHPSARYNPGKAVWCCDVCGASGGLINLAKRLGIETERRNGHQPERRIVATYDYEDANGNLLFQAVRYTPKQFSQRRPDGNGGWAWNLNGIQTVPYRLPELRAAPTGDPVFVVEGEKDVNRLRSLGLVATCNPMGAGKWQEWYSPHLAGRRVIIVPDNDGAGRTHAQQVAASVRAAGATSVKVLELAGLPPKGDVSDWLDQGHDVDELLMLAESAPEWEPPEEPQPILSTVPVDEGGQAPTGELSDSINAERFAQMYGDRFRWCAAHNCWYTWASTHWQRDQMGRAMLATKYVARSFYRDAAEAADDKRAKALADHARRSASEKARRAMLEAAKAEPGIAITPDQLDADQMLFNCLNGTIDLRTGELQPHRREDLITKLAPVKYDPDARLDLWQRFLDDATDRNAALQRFLQRAAGYSLTGRTDDEVFFFAHGPAATGKSTYMEALKAAWGDYAATADFESFLKRSFVGGVRNDIADLAGARLVLSIEVDEGKDLAEGLVKQLTGGDTVKARHLYREGFEFRPAFKLWLCANHAPPIKDDDDAMWRRILRLPFEHVIPKARRDPAVKATLRDPAIAGPAILAWAVQGCLDWQREGLGVPAEVERATDDLRAAMDPLADFIDECCLLAPNLWTKSANLQTTYARWCRERNEELKVKGKQWGERLRAKGCQRKDTRTERGWLGIGLRAAAQSTMDADDPGDPPLATESHAATECDTGFGNFAPARAREGDFPKLVSESVATQDSVATPDVDPWDADES